MSIFMYPDEEEAQGKLNIDDLYEKKQKRDLKQLSIFNKIIGRIHKKILFTARNKTLENFVWFNVPAYIVGEPIYDKGECIGYIVSQLEKNGFHVKYIHPNTLFISWHNHVP
jgi:predicted transcriptional regulator